MTFLDVKAIATRSMEGAFFSIGASVITVSSGFIRAVLLARLLLPEHFGVVTLALFYINLAGRLRGLGLSRAVIHREYVDERVAASYFTVQLVLLAGGLAVLLALAPLLGYFYPHMPLLASVLAALAGVDFLKGLNTYQETFLNRALAFRRLALSNVVASVVMTVLAPAAAWLDVAEGLLEKSLYLEY